MSRTVHSIAELEAEIKKCMRKAMEEAAKETKEDLEAGTEYFYSGGYPSMYQRTGALGDTPDVSPVSGDGITLSFVAQLKQDHGYSTGDRPSMAQVLELANYGTPWMITNPMTGDEYPAKPTVGNQGFWEKSLEEAKRDILIAFRRNLR